MRGKTPSICLGLALQAVQALEARGAHTGRLVGGRRGRNHAPVPATNSRQALEQRLVPVYELQCPVIVAGRLRGGEHVRTGNGGRARSPCGFGTSQPLRGNKSGQPPQGAADALSVAHSPGPRRLVPHCLQVNVMSSIMESFCWDMVPEVVAQPLHAGPTLGVDEPRPGPCPASNPLGSQGACEAGKPFPMSLERYLEYHSLLTHGTGTVKTLNPLEQSLLRAQDLRHVLAANGLLQGSRFTRKSMLERLTGARLVLPGEVEVSVPGCDAEPARPSAPQLSPLVRAAHHLPWLALPRARLDHLLHQGSMTCCDAVPCQLIRIVCDGHRDDGGGDEGDAGSSLPEPETARPMRRDGPQPSQVPSAAPRPEHPGQLAIPPAPPSWLSHQLRQLATHSKASPLTGPSHLSGRKVPDLLRIYSRLDVHTSVVGGYHTINWALQVSFVVLEPKATVPLLGANPAAFTSLEPGLYTAKCAGIDLVNGCTE